MKEIKRDVYLKKLIDRKENGLIKVITGIRRCGKSYLLNTIFYNYLLESGVNDQHIIKIALDNDDFTYLQKQGELSQYVKDKIIDKSLYYILLDEIQLVDNFEFVLNGLNSIENTDIYVTGSNSKFLSSDIITEFRGRSDEIRLLPLSFSEIFSVYNGSKEDAWIDYMTYGGLPLVTEQNTSEQKSKYLINLFQTTYIKDIVERNKIQRTDILDALINSIASSIGSLTNPNKLFKTFISKGEKEVSLNTVTSYLNFLMDSFMVEKVDRFDIKGKKYIGAVSKYYFSDIGLRNARINFRQLEENHIMENIIYNELIMRGFNVDVGIVEVRDKDNRKQLEVDFVCNFGSKRYYIQSALNLDTREKTLQEENSLININDNFKKIIVVKDNYHPWYTEEGILVIGIKEFLLNKNSLDL